MKYIQLIFKTFDQAYDECIKLDKSLLTVSSEEEQKMVYNELNKTIEQPTAFWISLKRGQGAMGDKVLTFQGFFLTCFQSKQFSWQYPHNGGQRRCFLTDKLPSFWITVI